MTLHSTELTLLDMISICGVLYNGSYPARYHVANLSRLVPRLAALNAGKDYAGNVDYGALFRQSGLEGLAALACRDQAYFDRSPPQQQVAIARRSLVLTVGTSLLAEGVSDELNVDLEAMMIERLRRSEQTATSD